MQSHRQGAVLWPKREQHSNQINPQSWSLSSPEPDRVQNVKHLEACAVRAACSHTLYSQRRKMTALGQCVAFSWTDEHCRECFTMTTLCQERGDDNVQNIGGTTAGTVWYRHTWNHRKPIISQKYCITLRKSHPCLVQTNESWWRIQMLKWLISLI